MEEVEHVIDVLSQVKRAIVQNDSAQLRNLSNQTIHTASMVQDSGSITLAVIVYAFAKLIERGDHNKIKHWNKFIKKIESFFSLAIKSLKDKKFEIYENYLEDIRKTTSSVAPNMKPYIQEVMRKAAINKASKIYEHGISMGQTAKLLGITQWELAEYAGEKMINTREVESPESVKQRASMALEFFS